jgi:histidinol-phosphate aminotransferase
VNDERRCAVPEREEVAALPLYRPGRSAAQAMADHGLTDAIKLASNELAFGPVPAVSAALARSLDHVNRYPDHRAVALRQRLAEHFDLPVDRVTVGAGSVGLLQQLAMAYVRPGDEVVFGDPSFEAYPIFTRLCGGRPRPVPLSRHTIDVDGILAASTERTRMVLVAQPNNPTGTAVSGRDLRRLAEGLPPTCLLVVDEAYHEFARARHLAPATSLLGRFENVVVLRTFSKAHGLAALRVGLALASPDVVEALDRCLVPFSVNALGQAAALASLEAEDEVEERVRAVVADRERTWGELAQLGFGIPTSEANFLWLPAGTATTELAEGLERKGVVARPFAGAGLRVTVGNAREDDRFLEALAKVVAGGLGERLEAGWPLPTGSRHEAVRSWLSRLAQVGQRLEALAQGGTRAGLTDPDPGGSERWEDVQVWAHLAEFPDYWADQLQVVLDGEAVAPVPFGRTKADPTRRGAVAAARREQVEGYLAAALSACDRLRALLSTMSVSDWRAMGVHPTLGQMGTDAILEEFLVGHLEEHAAQLESLRGR